MRPDSIQTAAARSGFGISPCPTVERLFARRAAGGTIVLLPSRLDLTTALALDHEPVEHLPTFHAKGRPGRVMRIVAEHLSSSPFGGETGLADWLIGDLARLSELFVAITGTEQISLRLETVTDNACARFHVDNVRYRLLITYRGPGTVYIDPRDAARATQGLPLTPGAIRQLDRGTAAIVRGDLFQRAGLPGVLHRSPVMAGTGTVRLVTVIDTVDAIGDEDDVRDAEVAR